MIDQTHRAILVFLFAFFLVSFLTACTLMPDGNKAGEPVPEEKEQMESSRYPVTLDIVHPGDPQPDQAAVTAALEAAMRDELNIRLSFQTIPWNDYATKVRVMTVAGNGIDLFWTYPELLSQLVMSRSVAPLDAAIDKYGSNLKRHIDPHYWTNVKYRGETYGVPSAQLCTATGYMQLTVRKDLREKYGLPPITSLADMEAFFEAVRRNNPDILPYATMAGSTIAGPDMYYNRSLPPGVSIDINTDEAVFNLQSPNARKTFKQIREWYLKGYLSKDVLLVKDFRAAFKAGKAAAVMGDLYEYNFNVQALKAMPGVELEFVKFLVTPEPYREVSSWNYQSVSAGSGKLEKAIQYLDWIQKDEKHYDLLSLGVEGKHYVIRDGVVTLPDGVDPVKNPYSPYEWIWSNPRYMKDRSTYTKGFTELYKAQDQDVRQNWKGMSFMFDSTPVKPLVATLNSIAGEYANALGSGTVDVDEVLPVYIERMKKAGVEKAVEEVQKQLDEYMATK